MKYYSVILALLLSVSFSEAQSRTNTLNPGEDPRGKPELTLCSQNLENYGLPEVAMRRDSSLGMADFEAKENAIVRRIVKTGCDVIAVQEVLGSDEEQAKAGLKRLATALRARTNRTFDIKVSLSNDQISRVGFLVAKDRAEIANAVSYARVELPKISEKQKPRFFARGPLEVQLLVKPREGSAPKTVTLVTFHFKSKAGGKDDPARLEWETYRMEMAEALRRIVDNRHAQSYAQGDTILALLGDRNSNFDVASAKILEGQLALSQFQEEGVCRLSKRGVALCQAGAALPQRLFSVLTTDPIIGKQAGTHTYKGQYSWLDDIIMPHASLPFAWKDFASEGEYDAGVVYEPKEASDHALTYVRLNW